MNRIEPGDWRCDNCNNVNFKRRDVCRDCGAPKRGVRVGDAKADRQLNKFDEKPGDKKCQKCGEINFAFRDRCRKCNDLLGQEQDRRVDNTNQRERTDWNCTDPKCRELNFGFRHICRKCNKLKPNYGQPEQQQTQKKPHQNDTEQDDESPICVVCLTEPRSHAITTCGHMCFCGVCGFNINQCPICRAKYDPDNGQLIKIYSC